MPQIELMSADLPHTLYKSKKTKEEEERDQAEEAIRLTREAAERRRKARESGQYTVSDVFEGIAEEE